VRVQVIEDSEEEEKSPQVSRLGEEDVPNRKEMTAASLQSRKGAVCKTKEEEEGVLLPQMKCWKRGEWPSGVGIY